MDMSTFIIEHGYMIDDPFAINRIAGFNLKNGMRILFKESDLTDKAIKRLKKIYTEERSK